MRNLTAVYLHEYHPCFYPGRELPFRKFSHGTTTFRPLVRATHTHTHTHTHARARARVGKTHSTIIPQSTRCSRCHMRFENGSESGVRKRYAQIASNFNPHGVRQSPLITSANFSPSFSFTRSCCQRGSTGKLFADRSEDRRSFVSRLLDRWKTFRH